jgi:hypothetical protein
MGKKDVFKSNFKRAIWAARNHGEQEGAAELKGGKRPPA